MASASRTALIAAGALALWWALCRLRTLVSKRLAGTVLIGLCSATMVVLPFLPLNERAFTGRAKIWAEGLSVWRQSRLVGLGTNWFTETAASLGDADSWVSLGSGHNLTVDTLVRSGLVGVCVLGLVLLAATRSTRAVAVSSHQTACFGYLIAFVVVSTTEAVWTMLPNMGLFPVVGLVFTVLIVTRPCVRPAAG